MHPLFADSTICPREKQQALNRVRSDPGVPDVASTSPFWLCDPHPQLSGYQSASLSTEADIVIIGSGITGASIARTLLQNRIRQDVASEHPTVVMLEARDICSGATGRNGGHILETGGAFAELADGVGMEAAKKIFKFRLSHLHEILNVADQWGLTNECQARKVQFLSVFFDEEPWSEALEGFWRFKGAMPVESADWRAYSEGEIPKEFHLPRARGVIAGPAGAIWPYKFVTGILAHLKEEFPSEFSIETSTPVTGIQISGQKYSVETTRGTIIARHVIHCTNAHAGHLVPGLRGRIYPVRGQMSAQTPGDKFPSQGTQHSWVFNYERGFDYLTQLPETENHNGQMMFGGAFAQSEGRGMADLGVATDSSLSVYMDIHLSGALGAVFGHENWGTVSGPPVQAMWTGNMGFSWDGFPWVGMLPPSLTWREGGYSETNPEEQSETNKSGAEWVSAAFSGDGMVQAWLCGKALGIMLLSRDGMLDASHSADLSWLPEQMLVTEERIRNSVLPRVVDETAKRPSNL